MGKVFTRSAPFAIVATLSSCAGAAQEAPKQLLKSEVIDEQVSAEATAVDARIDVRLYVGRSCDGTQTGEPCGRRTAGAGIPVRVVFFDTSEQRGMSDARGIASVRLDGPITPSSLQAGKADVLVRDARAGHVDLTGLAQWTSWHASIEMEAAHQESETRRQEYYGLLNQTEQRLAETENIISMLEQAPPPSSGALAEQIRTLVQQIPNSSTAAQNAFNGSRSVWDQLLASCRASCAHQASVPSCTDNDPRSLACVNPEPNLKQRIQALNLRVGRDSSRIQAMNPKIQQAAAILRRENEAMAVAFLQAWANSSNTGAADQATAGGSSDADQAAAETRHQQEREDDARRAQGEHDQRERDERDQRNAAQHRACSECQQDEGTCRRRCEEDERRCSDDCGPGSSGWTQCASGCQSREGTCNERCFQDDNSCRSRNNCGM